MTNNEAQVRNINKLQKQLENVTNESDIKLQHHQDEIKKLNGKWVWLILWVWLINAIQKSSKK